MGSEAMNANGYWVLRRSCGPNGFRRNATLTTPCWIAFDEPAFDEPVFSDDPDRVHDVATHSSGCVAGR